MRVLILHLLLVIGMCSWLSAKVRRLGIRLRLSVKRTVRITDWSVGDATRFWHRLPSLACTARVRRAARLPEHAWRVWIHSCPSPFDAAVRSVVMRSHILLAIVAVLALASMASVHAAESEVEWVEPGESQRCMHNMEGERIR